MQNKNRVKMYKSGKMWVFMTLTAVGLVATLDNVRVSADSIGSEGKVTQDVSGSNSSATQASNSTSSSATQASSSANSSATQASNSTDSGATQASNSTNSGATQASNSTDSGATQASNSTNSGATQTSNSTNSSATQASNSTNSSATQASSDNFTLSVRSTNSSDDNGDPVSITITKDNFSDYFLLTGDSSYNQATGTITLTKDQVGQAGYVTLKNKISMDRSFDLKGLVYMGNKLDSQGGADGMAFTLHPNNVGQVGYSGGSAGMAGIPNALGFKIDTFYNGLSPEVWTDDDPGGVNSPFAAWTKTNENGIPDILLNNPSVQYLNKDHFLNSNAGFVPFELSYDANTKVLKVVMDGMVWTHTYDESYTDLALAISASTGLSHNLQQIQLTSFNYSASPTNIAKQNAREALEKEVNNIKQDITNDNTLTSSEKSAQTKVADANYQEALNNVESQTSPDGVNQAKDAGIAAIDAAHQPGTSLADQKQAAKDALEAEAKKIQAAIDNDVTLTATEKSAQKQAVETAKQQGQANIDAATDNSELPNTSKSIEKNKNSGLWALILTLISGLLVTKKRNDQY